MTNTPLPVWVVANLPPGFKSQCPDDMDDYYYLWNVVFLINMAPDFRSLSSYSEVCQQNILGYYGEDESDNPNVDITNDERAWAVTELILADAIRLFPYLHPVIASLNVKYPGGFDLYMGSLDGNAAYLQIEEA